MMDELRAVLSALISGTRRRRRFLIEEHSPSRAADHRSSSSPLSSPGRRQLFVSHSARRSHPNCLMVAPQLVAVRFVI
ncbi:hypothetical protein Q1695_015615 [Nippostrongylus brasiliensis]|nr:hypothetical protein Q1695_015615 [Nippostrongylus brasiliensis]